ncbi:probable disease resistance protein At5g66900 [Quercus lobata]|uniref:probable disease resistance protein At5g66900 n=1 Tax=Quercus lobata TaxID=97700 RepID=UPI001245CB29|nr:probable disease resistance protein At5g66900 [Quercus lobata]
MTQLKSVGSYALMFKPILKSLQFNLNLLAPVVEEIRQLNKKLDHPEGETMSLIEDMRKAQELVVPGPPDITAGMDEPLKVLKMKLLEEKQRLLLTTLGGCRNTTLVKMLGYDQEIKEFHLEKFKFDMPNYNILVTSRTTLPGYSFTYNLKPLNDEDATTLLHHSASLQDGSSHISVEVIKKIVRGCGRFPLAPKVNGKSLRGKPVEAWRSRGRKWSSGHSIFNSSSDLIHCLQKSLELSVDEDNLKECFMDLGSFREDQRIPVLALIDVWQELYKHDEDGIDAIAILHELTSRNLANLVMTRKNASEINDYYN